MLRIADIIASVIIIINDFVIIGAHRFDGAEKAVSSIDNTYILFLFTAAMIFAKFELRKYIHNAMKQISIGKQKEIEKSIDIMKMFSAVFDFAVVLITVLLIAMWKLL